MRGPNREAVATVVDSLEQLGRLEDIDRALVVAAEQLAEQLDDPAQSSRASLWKEYGAALERLRAVGSSEPDGLADLLADLGATEMGDPKATGA